MGQIYVEVDASVANGGIMTLQTSGGEEGSYWINWDSANGFIGTGWDTAWKSANVPLASDWENSSATNYANTYDGFLSYVTTSGTEDLSK